MDRFERFAQRKIERSFRRTSAGGAQMDEIVAALTRALDEMSRNGGVASAVEISLRPEVYEQLAGDLTQVESGLSSYLAALVQERSLDWPHETSIRLARQPAQKESVVITVSDSEPAADTQPYRTVGASQNAESHFVADAFLIVEGKRHIHLDRHVITLGRQVDNDIVIDSPTVSRRHAQIRLRFGRYVIYDLGSRAGTWVNGQRVRESILQPGDVILLSDVAMIYAEGAELGAQLSGADVDRDGSTQILLRDRADEH